MSNPSTFYHGSLYKQKELMPGFKRSGELTTWDVTESNKNLYVSTDREEAIRLGIASALEKVFDSDRFATHGEDLTVYCKKDITLDDFWNLEVYLYTIPNRPEDEWVKNCNPHNNIETEWITQNTVRNIAVERINVRKFMMGKLLTFTKAPVATDPLNLLKDYPDVTVRHSFK